MNNSIEPTLSVKNLHVTFATEDGDVSAVNGINFDLMPGEIMGVVGESGSGKSQTFLSIMGLLAKNGRTSGSVKLNGQELIGISKSKLNNIRGSQISMIFQDPMTCLNPYMTIKKQMIEVLDIHRDISRQEAEKIVLDMMDMVHIPEPKKRLSQYPHEFSGGMRQRIMIAMALLCKPSLLIADEPTTALDVTVQAQVLRLLKELRSDINTSIVFITHDLGVVAGLCDHVAVMYGGRLVEKSPIKDLFASPNHPYTKGLLLSTPKLNTEHRHDKEIKLPTIEGNPPNLQDMPKGCAFSPRCSSVMPRCYTEVPKLFDLEKNRHSACFLHDEGENNNE